MSPFVLDNTP